MVVLEGIVLSVNKWVMSCGRPQQRDHSNDKRKEKRQKLTMKSKKSKEKRRKQMVLDFWIEVVSVHCFHILH